MQRKPAAARTKPYEMQDGADEDGNTVNSWVELTEPEWLRSIPDDLEKNWIVVPFPVGKRCRFVGGGKWVVVSGW